MAGIYFHIPYCKQACHYCDFHFSTNIKTKELMLGAMLSEMETRQNFMADKQINTIYFGGGTPSLLSADELNALINKCRQLFEVNPDAEITLEANPDDLTEAKLKGLAKIGVNRLSIGIQSFFEEHLKWMNRAHNSEQAINCIALAQAAGFTNISADLIYGFPDLSDDQFLENIHRLTDAGVPHISAYSLTVEPKTALDRFIEIGKYAPVNDSQAAAQFLLLSNTLESLGYEHYEVSNFALPGMRSKHNSAYWSGSEYLGIGPGAHSFNGHQRCWNVRSNQRYIKEITEENYQPECEDLSQQTRYNEHILTRFRTVEGVNLQTVKQLFGVDITKKFERELNELLGKDEIISDGSYLRLTKKGLLWADSIASNFFIVEDDNKL
jgi:oxygen-independent coproporphyrinogen III oxidase